jgi:two-component system, cell cycle response regulator
VEILQTMLQTADYDVVTANSGPEALERVVEHRPDLILLDVMMVGMNGLEVCERLRVEPTLTETPIVLLTVLEDAGVRDRGRAVGATALWPKACGSDELLEKVTQLLGRTARPARQ